MIRILKIIGCRSLASLLVVKHSLPCLIVILLSGCSTSARVSESYGQSKEIIIDDTTKIPVYSHVDRMPQYKNGAASFHQDFAKNFVHDYQNDELVQTKTIVIFIINTNGELVGERIKGKSTEELTGFERDVLKAIHSLQPWICGQHNGINVNVRISLPIHIDIR